MLAPCRSRSSGRPRPGVIVPMREIWVGVATDGTEVPERVDRILDALTGPRAPRGHAARRHGAASRPRPGLRRVPAHASATSGSPGPYDELVGQDRVVPYFFPTPAMTQGMPVTPGSGDARQSRTVLLRHDDPGRAGHLGGRESCRRLRPDRGRPGRRRAARRTRCAGRRATTRPPAGTADPATSTTPPSPPRRCARPVSQTVAVVDLDAHHGNGTQAIFWERSDVRYGSLHVDPADGWFPHFFGHADETGAGDGTGATRNLPLPEGTGDRRWLDGVGDLAEWVDGADALVVSLGVDAAARRPGEPVGGDGRRLRPRGGDPRAGSRCRRWSCRRAATTSARSAGWSPPASTGSGEGSGPAGWFPADAPRAMLCPCVRDCWLPAR